MRITMAKMDVHEVTIEVTVPAGASEETVRDMMTRMIGSAQHVADDLIEDGGDAGCAKLVVQSEFSVRDSCYDRSEGTDLDCHVDVDDAHYVGDDNDGVYYQVFEDDDGKFWMSALVDCDSAGFVDSLVDADGPYDSHGLADQAGIDVAVDWCAENEIYRLDGENE
jgi:hypothetical protein